MVVTVSHSGYIKRVPVSTYRAQKRGGKGRSGMSMKAEDTVNVADCAAWSRTLRVTSPVSGSIAACRSSFATSSACRSALRVSSDTGRDEGRTEIADIDQRLAERQLAEDHDAGAGQRAEGERQRPRRPEL